MIGSLALGGCQRPAGVLFPAIDPPLVWPAAPERPRIEWVGALADSAALQAVPDAGERFHALLHGPRPPIRLLRPNGVAWHPDRRLAVVDTAAAAVHIIDLARRTHHVTLGSAERPLATPVGVAWHNDDVVVTDAERGEVVVFDAAGRVLRRFGEGALQRPVGIAWVAERDAFYVVDGGRHGITVLDPRGTVVQQWGERGAAPEAFNYPTHIASDGRGRLAVADSGNFRVQIMDLDGRVLQSIGHKGDAAGDLALPKGVAFDSAGHLYVVDGQFENFQIFDSDGRLLLAVGQEGTAPGEFALPAGLAIGADDHIWVADSANGRIQVFRYLADTPHATTVAGGGM